MYIGISFGYLLKADDISMISSAVWHVHPLESIHRLCCISISVVLNHSANCLYLVMINYCYYLYLPCAVYFMYMDFTLVGH